MMSGRTLIKGRLTFSPEAAASGLSRRSCGDGRQSEFSFGTGVAISRQYHRCRGSPGAVGANPFQGSTYVFTRSGSVWTQQARLVATDGAASDNSASASRLAAIRPCRGLPGDVGTNFDQGSAYVFTRSGSVWTQQAQLIATGGTTTFRRQRSHQRRYGIVGALTRETAIKARRTFLSEAAALDAAGPVLSDRRRRLTFRLQRSHQRRYRSRRGWIRRCRGKLLSRLGICFYAKRQRLDPTGKALSGRRSGANYFGESVAISGDTVVVGAYERRRRLGIYFYPKRQRLDSAGAINSATDGAGSDGFGLSVAISGNEVIVGADRKASAKARRMFS